MAERVNSYFDHDFPTYWVNGTIEIYNGWTATNAITCTNRAYRHIGSGTCLYYDGHPGYDFDLDYEPVLAAADGTVIRAGWVNWNDRTADLGLRLYITHTDGYETRYGHLSAIAVLTNTQVYHGQIIGASGDTGNSTGRHLHFEVRLNDTPTDPFGGSNSHWLWVNGTWTGNWANHYWGGGQLTPHYGITLSVDDDNPRQVGDPDDDPNFTKGQMFQDPGGWSYAGSCPPNQCPDWYTATIGNDGDMLWTYTFTGTGDYWALWRPPQSGLYDVQVFIPNANATTWGARYCLMWSYNYMPTMCSILVDQNGITNRWLSLGVYQFGMYPSAPWAGIWVSDGTGEPYAWAGRNQLGVDAVRFRPPWVVYLPIVLKNHPPPAPFVTIVLDAPQPDGDNGWYVSDVEVSFTVPPTMSLPPIEYRLNVGEWRPFTMPFTITTEGENLVQIRPAEIVTTSVPFSALTHRMRLANTNEEILSFVIKIDKSQPTLAVIAPQPITYTHSVTFMLDYQAIDIYSGLAAITATLDAQPVIVGQMVDTLVLGHGMHEFDLAARDVAGHTAEQTVVFTVTTTISGLIDLKHRLYAEGGIYGPGAAGIVQSLDAKLEAAQRNLDAGQLQAAINNLQAFIHEVEAQTGKHITPDAAQLMIEDAQRIIASLSSGQSTRAVPGTMFILSGDK